MCFNYKDMRNKEVKELTVGIMVFFTYVFIILWIIKAIINLILT